jgi:O-antigen ligase
MEMHRKKVVFSPELLILVSTVLITVAILPSGSLDPMNLPKLTLLIVFGFILIGFVVTKKEFLKENLNRSVLILSFLFLLQLCLVFILDDRDFSVKFYGVQGRNTGLLAYFSLTFFLVTSVMIASNKFIQTYMKTFASLGLILGIYGVLQSNNIEFFRYENLYASRVFGTFGNPNFQSAFMGMVAAAAITLLLFAKLSFFHRICLFILILVCLFNIFVSSEQGYLALAAGLWASITVYFLMRKKLITGLALIFSGSISGVLVILGILNKGPLSQYLFESSLQARSFYWQAATNMIVSNPLKGVGMDAYGDWYRRARSEYAASIGPDTVADSAHNIVLDLGASGGVPLMLFYLLFIIIAVLSITKMIKSQSEVNPYYLSLVGVWVAYQAQSIISINQLGLGIWGWTMTGLLIGFRPAENPGANSSAVKGSKVAIRESKKSPNVALMAFGLAGLLIAAPNYQASHNFYRALVSADPQRIQESVYENPQNSYFYTYVARVMLLNNYNREAIQILRDATDRYPDSTELWKIWLTAPTASVDEIQKAKSNLKRLDPYNPNLRKL